MNLGRTVFAQLIAFLPHREFRRRVGRYDGDSGLRGFSCWDQYLTMAFAQLTYRESLRDIEACLRAMSAKLYHMGFHGKVARSTLADANESRDWRIYAEFAQVLIRIARPLYASDPIGVEIDQSMYALGFDHHRSLSVAVSVGQIPQAQSRGQNAHAAGSARQHSHVHPHHGWQGARREHPRRDPARGRCVLRHGSRLHRFRATLRVHGLV